MTTDWFTFLHAADLHIDSPLRGLERYEEAPAEEIRAATREAFENLVRRAIELQVAFVVLAGDVFDGRWKDYGTGLWFAARLRELTSQGIHVYLVAGNHDAEGKMTMALEYPEGVHAFRSSEPETFTDEATGAILHGQSFAKAATTEDLAADYPVATAGAMNIGVLHTALTGRVGHDNYAPCSPDTLRAKGYNYWALGHIHQREVVSADPWIVFPGNLQARHVRETGAKGATLVAVEGGRIVSVTEETLDVVRFARVRVDVSSCSDRTDCEDAVAHALFEAKDDADGRLLAVRVEVTGRTGANAEVRREVDAFVARCRDLASDLRDVWVEKVNLETQGLSVANGRDIIEALELDADELSSAVRKAATADFKELLAKLPAGANLAEDGLDLRDEATLCSLLDEARDDLVRRLVDADPTSHPSEEA
jgi:exonuclease SbcD